MQDNTAKLHHAACPADTPEAHNVPVIQISPKSILVIHLSATRIWRFFFSTNHNFCNSLSFIPSSAYIILKKWTTYRIKILGIADGFHESEGIVPLVNCIIGHKTVDTTCFKAHNAMASVLLLMLAFTLYSFVWSIVGKNCSKV